MPAPYSDMPWRCRDPPDKQAIHVGLNVIFGFGKVMLGSNPILHNRLGLRLWNSGSFKFVYQLKRVKSNAGHGRPPLSFLDSLTDV